MEPLFLPGAGADPSRSEPKSAPGPWPSGAVQKSAGSATLLQTISAAANYKRRYKFLAPLQTISADCFLGKEMPGP